MNLTPSNILLAVLVLLLVYIVLIYNKLVKYRVESENAFFQIDVQLKRRHELIPNLVETVRGYMQHERETLRLVTEARARALKAANLSERLQAEGEIGAAISRLLAVWEQYPDLKANQNALKLQEELVTTENRIAYSRGYYNDIAANYNTLLKQFPSNLLAGLLGFAPRLYFTAGEAERAAPTAKF